MQQEQKELGNILMTALNIRMLLLDLLKTEMVVGVLVCFPFQIEGLNP